EITTVERDTEYKAVYIKKYIDYTVIFKDENGNIINSKVYHYGDTLIKPQDPVKESTIEYAYTFTGWIPEVSETVTKNAEYTAIFEEQEIKYSIIFYNYDGITEVSRIEDYTWGDSFVFPESPTKEPTEEIYYVFTAWNNLGVEEITATEKRIKLVAQYREEYFVARVESTDTLEGVSYFSLEEAIENAGSEERTVRLLQDTEESVMVEDNQNITINLNGKTVTGTKNYAIKNYGVLVITDETEEKTGKIVDIVTSEIGYGIHNKEGQVTIKGGTIVTETSQESGATYGIYNQSESPLVIEGGSIIAEAKGKGSISAGIYNLAGEEITVTGGYVLGNATAENATSYGIYNETEGKINVTNGRVEGKTSLASGVSYGIYNEISQEVIISGGTVAAQSDKSTAYGVYNNQGKVTVTEGNIEVTAATGYGIYNETGVVDVQAGKTTMIGTSSYGIYNNSGIINVSGGNIESTSSTAYGIYNKNQMNITGGEIISKTSSSSTYGIYNNSEKDLSIQNVKITDLDKGIYNNAGKVEVTNANITASTGIHNNTSSAN
ncbi:MAG: InlB B-repeat-containing protein, partial [Clostridia bacterium]|nr:InlB B-repeat-containing protein [Clostridia bacterium]